MRNPLRHLISLLTSLCLAANLMFWLIPLTLMAIMRVLLSKSTFRRWCFPITEASYRGAVAVNSFWLEKVLGIAIDVQGDFNVPRHSHCVVVSNHKCWIDIVLLQAVLVPRGPIVKFLIKKQLSMVPVVGWICLALDFPRLQRNDDKKSSRADFESLRNATDRLDAEPAALLNFVESTRFSQNKKVAQKSRYRYLLNPKSGGLRILLNSLPPEGKVLDTTLIYPAHDPTFWEFISGAVRQVKVVITEWSLAEIEQQGVKSWLDGRWTGKDELLAKADSEGLEHLFK